MALEGTLDTVSLPELLRLLTAGKSGRVVISGERGTGAVDVRHGRVTAVETERTGRLVAADSGAGLAEGLFELLRSDGGAFAFSAAAPVEDGSEEAVGAGSPLAAVEALVEEATDLLARWREVEVVVPSLRVGVEVVASPPDGEAVLDAERWPVLVAAARSTTVAEVGERLELDEVRVSYAVRDLVAAGLLTVGPEVEVEVEAPDPVMWDTTGEVAVVEPPPTMAMDAVEVAEAAPELTEAEVDEVVTALAAEPQLTDATPADAPAVPDAPAGEWADEEVLDQVFAEWVPGPPPEAHPLERDMLTIDRSGQEDEDAGVLDRLLGTLRK